MRLLTKKNLLDSELEPHFKMKIIFISFFVFIVNFQSSLKAEIAYIDINFILNNSDVGKNLNKYIKDINNKNLLTYKNRESDLLNKEKLLLSQQNILEKSEFDKKLKILSREVQKYRSDKKKYTEEVKQIKINNTKRILNLLNPIITKYVDDNSISLVIPKKNIIVGKKNLDITDQIIILLNNQIKSLDF